MNSDPLVTHVETLLNNAKQPFVAITTTSTQIVVEFDQPFSIAFWQAIRYLGAVTIFDCLTVWSYPPEKRTLHIRKEDIIERMEFEASEVSPKSNDPLWQTLIDATKGWICDERL